VDKNKVIIVVGGTGGVGSEICRKLYEKGHIVICVSRGVTDSLVEFNDRIIHKTCDVSSGDECKSLVQSIANEYGRLDALIYSAIGYHYGAPEEHDTAVFLEVFKGNVFGANNISNACLPYLKVGSGGNRICYIGSTAGYQVLPNRSAYSSSKASLKMLMMCQAVDWSKYGLSVNMVTTSYVATEYELAGAESAEWGHSYQDIINRTPKKRPAYPREIAESVLWAILDAPDYMTGSDIVVDGGWSAWSGFGNID